MNARSLVTGMLWAALGMLPSLAAAQDCGQIQELLRQGNSVSQISRATGLSSVQIEACRRATRQKTFTSPQGPPPLGAAGPAPPGAAGPPPHGAAGPAPHGAAGPPPFGPQ
jgi:hypothetical protein